MLYSYKGQYPTSLPERIRLSDGSTRTDSSTFTNEELTDAGYVAAGDSPSFDGDTQKVTWNGSNWEVVSLTSEEISARTARHWDEVRQTRDEKIRDCEWRIFRYQSEVRIGVTTTTDNINELDTYIQALRDITTTNSDPISVSWPSVPD